MKHLYHLGDAGELGHCYGCWCGPYPEDRRDGAFRVGVCPFDSPTEYREAVE